MARHASAGRAKLVSVLQAQNYSMQWHLGLHEPKHSRKRFQVWQQPELPHQLDHCNFATHQLNAQLEAPSLWNGRALGPKKSHFQDWEKQWLAKCQKPRAAVTHHAGPALPWKHSDGRRERPLFKTGRKGLRLPEAENQFSITDCVYFWTCKGSTHMFDSSRSSIHKFDSEMPTFCQESPLLFASWYD